MVEQVSTKPEAQLYRASAENANLSPSEHQTQPGVTGVQQKSEMSAATAAMVNAGTIPDLRIDNSPSNDSQAKSSGYFNSIESDAMHILSGAGQVTKDLVAGAKNELSQHGVQVAESFFKGVAIAGIAGTALVGAALVAPEALVAVGAVEAGIAIGGAVYGGYELATHAGTWAADASTVANPQDHTKDQLAAANSDLKQVGAGATLVTAGVAGSLVTAPISGLAVSDAVAGYSTAAAVPLDISASGSGGSVSDVLAHAVQSGQYEVQSVNGVSVFVPKTPGTVQDVLDNALASGQYQAQSLNGINVLMPRAS